MLKFASHIDTIDIDHVNQNIVLGLSNLDGNYWDGSIVQLSIINGIQINQIQCEAGISCVKYMNDSQSLSKIIISGGDDGNIGIFDSTLTNHKVLSAHDDIVSSLLLSQTSINHFFSSSWDSSINQWDIESLQCITNVSSAHIGMINHLDSSNLQPNLIASVGIDGYFRLWDTRTLTSSCCEGILSLGMVGSTVNMSKFNENECYIGTDAGSLNIIDIRFSNSTSITVKQDIQSYRLRVRKILTSRNRPGFIISCSDDGDIVSHCQILSNYNEFVRTHKHNDCVSDIAWIESHNFEDVVYSTSFDKTLQQSIINMNHNLRI